MIIWPRAQVLGTCKSLAPLVSPIAEVDSAQMLAALAQNESSLGANCGPRYEPSWDIGGNYASDPTQARLLANSGVVLAGDGKTRNAAACSYGPLQVLFYNVPGYTAAELNTDLTLVMRASISYLSRQIQHWSISTLQAIGEMWNWGHPDRPLEVIPVGVQLYCKDLAVNYVAAADWLEGV